MAVSSVINISINISILTRKGGLFHFRYVRHVCLPLDFRFRAVEDGIVPFERFVSNLFIPAVLSSIVSSVFISRTWRTSSRPRRRARPWGSKSGPGAVSMRPMVSQFTSQVSSRSHLSSLVARLFLQVLLGIALGLYRAGARSIVQLLARLTLRRR